MKTKICLPIIKSTMQEVVDTIDVYQEHFDVFEIWVDYIEQPVNVILNEVKNLLLQFDNRLIIVFRRKNGEQILMSFEDKMKIISSLENSNIFVDVDVQKQRKELEEIKNSSIKTKLITSFHNYEKTPRTSLLVNIIEDMEPYNPAMYKIATYCQNPKNAITLMHLLLDLKEQKKKVVILGMGKEGKITRIFGALQGNEITFAPEIQAEEVAPDQLTRKELEEIISIMECQRAG